MQALVYCIESCFFSLSWGLYYLENHCEKSAFSEVLTELRTNLHKYMGACMVLVRNGQTIQIQEAVSVYFVYLYLFLFFHVTLNVLCVGLQINV